MRGLTRLAAVGGAAFIALAFAGTALASYKPSLCVQPLTTAPGKPTTVRIEHFQSVTDDATAKHTIYVPLGYGVSLTQPVGTKIGDIAALLVLRQLGNTEVQVQGTVTVDDPANY